jgi:hypothetical protein
MIVNFTDCNESAWMSAIGWIPDLRPPPPFGSNPAVRVQRPGYRSHGSAGGVQTDPLPLGGDRRVAAVPRTGHVATYLVERARHHIAWAWQAEGNAANPRRPAVAILGTS